MIIGIDLGTTNSLAACFTKDGPVIIPNRQGKRLTPSAVSVDSEGNVYVGDAAVDEMLDVIEALCPNGENPHRHGVVHCQITTRDQWDRFAALHAGALVQPVFLDYDHTIVTARCGAELAATSYAFGTAV